MVFLVDSAVFSSVWMPQVLKSTICRELVLELWPAARACLLLGGAETTAAPHLLPVPPDPRRPV